MYTDLICLASVHGDEMPTFLLLFGQYGISEPILSIALFLLKTGQTCIYTILNENIVITYLAFFS